MIIPPITYQGGKNRLAANIIDLIPPSNHFHDLCCGSGAISIELINRGYPVKQITMLDKSPWGLFWKMIGDGSFNLTIFNNYINDLPKDVSKIQDYVKELSKQPANVDIVYIYLILQAASFGGKAIWIDNNKWKNCSFRNYWLPTPQSNRRSPVNPMMPMPSSLFKRIETICDKMYGICGLYQDIIEYYPTNGIVYIDPPYEGTTKYGSNFNVIEYAKKCPVKCYISEGKPLSSKSTLISSGRKKGGISGDRKIPNEEWLSELN